MTVNVRHGRETDLDALLGLWWELHQFHVKDLKAKKDFIYVPDVMERIRKHYTEKVIPKKLLLVAEDNGKLVGFCEFGGGSKPPIYKYPQALEIFCLYVRPSHRRKGIGKALLKELDVIKKLTKVKDVTVSAHVNNTDAISFYSSLGFRKRMMQMVKS